MRSVRIAFEKLEGVSEEQMRSGKIKPGYKFATTNMIFDIKMDGKFTRKARLVGDGHKTDTPSSICLLYTSPSPRDRTRSRMPSSA